jgi:hypothetical protein
MPLRPTNQPRLDQQLHEQATLIEKLQARTRNNRPSNNTNNDRRTRTPANQDPPRAQRHFPGNRNYCWSCGFDIANKHTSLTCIFKKYGHLDTATVTNPEGGSQQQMHLTNTCWCGRTYEPASKNKTTKKHQIHNSSRTLSHQANHLNPTIHSAIADTGCTDHFLPQNCPVENVKPTLNGIIVGLPDTSTMQATHTCNLKLPNLPRIAQQAQIFPKMQSALLSIPKLCDAGCRANFSATGVVIRTKNGAVALIGRRDPLTKLWEVPLTTDHDDPTKHPNPSETNPTPTGHNYAHNAYKQKTKQDLLLFLHAAAGSPTVAT